METSKNITLSLNEIRRSRLFEDDQEFIIYEDYLDREEGLIKFCVKYFSLNVSTVAGEHIPKVEKFKKELKEFMDRR